MDTDFRNAKPNSAGKYRAHGYKGRVWIAIPNTGGRLREDTVMKIRDFQGNTEEVFAAELRYS